MQPESFSNCRQIHPNSAIPSNGTSIITSANKTPTKHTPPAPPITLYQNSENSPRHQPHTSASSGSDQPSKVLSSSCIDLTQKTLENTKRKAFGSQVPSSQKRRNCKEHNDAVSSPPTSDPSPGIKRKEVPSPAGSTARSHIYDDPGLDNSILAYNKMVNTMGKRRTQTDISSLAWRVRCVEESLECLFRTRTGLLLGMPNTTMELPPEMQNTNDPAQMLLSMSKLLGKLFYSISFIEARYRYLLPVPLETPPRSKKDSCDK